MNVYLKEYCIQNLYISKALKNENLFDALTLVIYNLQNPYEGLHFREPTPPHVEVCPNFWKHTLSRPSFVNGPIVKLQM